jgi:flagellar hook-associated protein 3 FlgL
VDLVPADLVDVATLLAKVNAEASSAGLTIGAGPGEFEARMDPDSNRLVLEDRLGGGGSVVVTSLNGYAAEDLGFLDGTTSTGTPASLTGSDRTSVRVESLFTTLMDLKGSLERDDARGITFAGERLETDLDRLNRARALIGGRAQRVEEGERRLEDKAVLDTSIKSSLQDLDFFEASSRLTLLQTQLQASVQVAARTAPLTLLNFL